MSRSVLLHQWALATASRVLSASDEEGLGHDAVTPGASNNGALSIAASGIPLAAYDVDIALTAGGLALGYSSPTSGFSSAAARWKNSADTSSQWRGYQFRLFPSYYRVITQAQAALDFPHCSGVRQLADGARGFVVACDAATDSLRFRKASTRTGIWSSVTISSSGIDSTYRPDCVVLPTGRILAFAYVSTYTRVEAWYSDDDGATWATWSSDTKLGFEASSRSISAAVVGDAICVVTGATYDSVGEASIYWSLDAGQSFVRAASDLAIGSPRVAATANGRCILAYVNTTSGNVETYPLEIGGGLGAGTAEVAITAGGNTTNPNCAICLADDGTLWVAAHSGYPMNSIEAKVSIDNGASWGAPGGSSTADDLWIGTNAAGTARGYREINLGEWEGAIVVTAIASSQTAAHDNALHEMHVGGWDSMPEGYSLSSTAYLNTDSYGDAALNTQCYIAGDYPENTNWTRTDVGAGAARTLEDKGLQVVSTAVDNTYWDAPASAWAPASGSAYRGRFYFDVSAGPTSPVTGVCILFLSISDGANRQWIEFEFAQDQVTIRDTTGQIAASASVASQFNTRTELFFSFAHDYPAAGGGLVSAWYRIAGNTHWTQLASNLAVGEQAGVATELLRVGGSVATIGGATWTFVGPFIAGGGGGFPDGFTNPTDLVGRELSAAFPCRVTSGLRLSAFGGPGIQGDTYTASSLAAYAARNIWLNSRPSCQWRATDNANANVVFYGDDHLAFDTVILAGTNVPEITVQLNLTDAWATPAVELSLSAVVWTGTATSNSTGVFVVSGANWVPHRFRSMPGRRWFVEVGAVPGLVYEVADNTTETLTIEGLADTFGGAALRIFCDRMGAVLSTERRMRYARIYIGARQTAAVDDAYHVGAFLVGVRHVMEYPYDHGFVDRWLPREQVWEGDAGYKTSVLRGPERHELRVAWDLLDRRASDYMERLVDFFRRADGGHRVIALWRDPPDPSTIGLYRVTGPPARENAWGENEDELARLAQMVLVEEV